MFKLNKLTISLLAVFALSGCQSNADNFAADVYDTTQVNSKQETKMVTIVSVLPAKIAVDNPRTIKI